MKKADIVVGQTYIVKVSGRLTSVALESISPYGGWNGRNTRTGREVRIRTAAKLRHVAAPTAAPTPRITLVCNECKHSWKVSPNASGPQCANCNSVDYEIKES